MKNKKLNKDTNIRVYFSDYKELLKVAKQEDRTLKSMFSVIINDWLNNQE